MLAALITFLFTSAAWYFFGDKFKELINGMFKKESEENKVMTEE